MKKILFLLLSTFSFFNVFSQENPIKWKASYTSISATEGEIIVVADIDKGWHTYSQQPNNAVPIPTFFSYKGSKDYELIGSTEENNAHEEFDAALGEKLLVFVDKAEFKQKVRLNTKKAHTIFLKIEYICCDNKMCLPPTTIDLSVKVQ
ncbi:protein-disulfide reductase DsbD domain-containing protein [Aurantibacillus circumpalustris]|uniref:protein-disulfide reductase DsbD domain-containing protein n=1 Tax=Aurantibacillus circumpalustris TaxID=3036359 RepID=UPI00295BC267|nr:protein-disulfide reductase DsbD domain-containing protein [Aurantibacillus circumpalustris]